MVKKVLFTAPDTYQPHLCMAMAVAQNNVINPVFVPFINTFLYTEHTSFVEFCSVAASYDYVICSSKMAVWALQSSGMEPSLLEGKVIAIGNDQLLVKDMLGFDSIMQDAKPSMMGIVDALKHQPALSAKRIAVLMPEFTGLPVPSTITCFLNALSNTGASVINVYCYRTVAMEQEHYAKAVEYILEKEIDAIAITSGGEAHVLSKLLSFAVAQGKPIDVPIYSYGPYTTRCAQEVSLPIAGTSPKYKSFLDFIDYLSTK